MTARDPGPLCSHRGCYRPATHRIEAGHPNSNAYRATLTCPAHHDQQRRWAAHAGPPTTTQIAQPDQPALF